MTGRRFSRAELVQHLTELGWDDLDTTGKIENAVWRFQIAWMLGTQLADDRDPGPLTCDALGISVARKRKRQTTMSEHFSWTEARCKGGPGDRGCERIVVNRALLLSLEVARPRLYATKAGLQPASWYRCPTHNRRVGGAENSQHLFGSAVDTPMTHGVKAWRDLGTYISGLGWQQGTGLVRHVDTEGQMGAPKTRRDSATPANPATWRYC